jgi:hypothetical protein
MTDDNFIGPREPIDWRALLHSHLRDAMGLTPSEGKSWTFDLSDTAPDQVYRKGRGGTELRPVVVDVVPGLVLIITDDDTDYATPMETIENRR